MNRPDPDPSLERVISGPLGRGKTFLGRQDQRQAGHRTGPFQAAPPPGDLPGDLATPAPGTVKP